MFRQYTTTDGLSQNRITSILQDSRGFMWFGTYDGLNRFDGYTFRVYKRDNPGNEKISNNFVNALAEDKNGNIWIGTGDGLNVYLYEKNRIVRYKKDDGTGDFLPSGRINALLSDMNGYLWIGTDQGISKIETGSNGEVLAISYPAIFPEIEQQAGLSINTFYQQDNTGIWIGTNQGLFHYSFSGKEPEHFQFIPSDPQSLSNNLVQAIFADRAGTLWVGTMTGLNRALDTNGHFERYVNVSTDPLSLVHNVVTGISEDRNGQLLIGTLGGLSIYNREKNNFSSYTKNEEVQHGLNNEFISVVYPDQDGNVWIGTERGGINRYSIYQNNFDYLVHNINDPNSLSNNIVNSVYEDGNAVWIGTAGGGLNRLDKNTGRFRHYLHDAGNPATLSNDFVTTITRDKRGVLWVGTWGTGLHRLLPGNEKEGIFDHYGTPAGLIDDYIAAITEDDEGWLWIATRGGLDRFNPLTTEIRHVTGLIMNQPLTEVGSLRFDRDGNLWIGTIHGLFMIPERATHVVGDHFSEGLYYSHDPKDPTSLPGNYITYILCDHSNNIWLGTYGNGIAILDRDRSTPEDPVFHTLTEEAGLANNIVYSILEDNGGGIWIATENGLSGYNPLEGKFRNYYMEDGLQGNQFYWSAAFKKEDGKLYFGGMNGLICFNPETLLDYFPMPRLCITDFSIYSEPINAGDLFKGDVILEKSIFLTNHISLPYSTKEFSFEFSALSYYQPDNFVYSYKMEPFDDQWIEVSSKRRFASYTNLPGGEYTFMVKARYLGDNRDYPPKTIKINIIPPFYATWWFRIALLVFFGIIIFSYNRYRSYTLRKQKRILEMLVKKRTAQIEEQKLRLSEQAENLSKTNLMLEQQKEQIEGQNERLEQNNSEILSQRDMLIELNKKVQKTKDEQLEFFTYISHEFRTPLTLILTPLEKLMEEFRDAPPATKMKGIHNNALRLLHLINQLMEIRRLEKAKNTLRVSEGNISRFLAEIVKSFTPLANQKGVHIRLVSNPADIHCLFDPERLENVIYNLLSNAFKYTPARGRISITAYITDNYHSRDDETVIISRQSPGPKPGDRYVEISISDTGIGIPGAELKEIFRRFYRVPTIDNKRIKGTGIGLYLTRELIKEHQGFLFIKSRQGVGTTFRFIIPFEKSAYSGEMIETGMPVQAEVPDRNIQFELLSYEIGHDNRPTESVIKKEKNIKPSVLLIDDDQELCSMVSEHLSGNYDVSSAGDGKEGLVIARKQSPDLIISDVMMPEMDGMELCTALKSDLNTSHIPIILLTAKAEVQSQIEGLETGADEYVPKPFNMRLLEAKIHNLIENRKRLKNSFSHSLEPVVEEVTNSKPDRDFLERTMKLLEENIQNPGFSVSELAAGLFISKSLLHKKLTAVVGLSPVNFINAFRLKRSAILLRRGNLSISDVAYEVGFNDPKYFTRCFKKYFGEPPSSFTRESNENEAANQ
ncbi:MAG: two-component regulator propeller domain-containing protein [Bacteroidota bacterium]